MQLNLTFISSVLLFTGSSMGASLNNGYGRPDGSGDNSEAIGYVLQEVGNYRDLAKNINGLFKVIDPEGLNKKGMVGSSLNEAPKVNNKDFGKLSQNLNDYPGSATELKKIIKSIKENSDDSGDYGNSEDSGDYGNSGDYSKNSEIGSSLGSQKKE